MDIAGTVDIVDLHSIMYLLILGGDPQNGISKYHLHSIMYLLIHVKPNAVFKMFLAFTFHNVSINSLQPSLCL